MKRKSISIIIGIMVIGLLCSCGKKINSQEEKISQEQTSENSDNEDLTLSELDAKSKENPISDQNEKIGMDKDKLNEAETPIDITQYLTVSATSTLTGGDYSEINLLDNNLTTAWVEGKSGYGIEESITFQCDDDFIVTGMEIANGYQKNEALITENGQVKELGFYEDNVLIDTINLEQCKEIGQISAYDNSTENQIECNSITLKIMDTFTGSKFEDTCISDIKIFGYLKDNNLPQLDKKVTSGETSENTVLDMTVVMNRKDETDREIAEIDGYNEDGSIAWTYKTNTDITAELTLIQEIGVVGEAYYFVNQGTIIALDVRTGKELWKNKEFEGASIQFDFDENNNLYICGYYGPDLFAVDQNGKTIFRVEHVSEYYWPYKVDYEDGNVTITFEGSDEGTAGEVVVDAKTGKVK